MRRTLTSVDVLRNLAAGALAFAVVSAMGAAAESDLLAAIRADDLAGVEAAVRADPNALNHRAADGTTPLLYAAYREREAIVARLRAAKRELDFFEACAVGDLARMRTEVARGVDVNVRAPDGFTPLGLAVFFRRQDAARYLIEVGADVNAQADNSLRVGPIHAAVARADLALLELLLARGADPDRAQLKLVRPLHDAAASGNLAVTAMLLAYGADPSARTEEGWTPADLARQRGHADLATLLERVARTRATGGVGPR
jgi:ankyrin repeat protein